MAQRLDSRCVLGSNPTTFGGGSPNQNTSRSENKAIYTPCLFAGPTMSGIDDIPVGEDGEHMWLGTVNYTFNITTLLRGQAHVKPHL